MRAALFAAVAALAGLALAPAAHAQATCQDVANLLSEAEDDFASVTGPDLEELGHYASGFTMPGARECSIWADWDALHVCIWDAPDAESAANLVNTYVTMLRTCLTDEWNEEALADDETNIQWRLISGATFMISVSDEQDLVFTARADRSIDGTAPTYEVELSLNSMWF